MALVGHAGVCVYGAGEVQCECAFGGGQELFVGFFGGERGQAQHVAKI